MAVADRRTVKRTKSVVLTRTDLPPDPTHTEQPEFGVYAKPLTPQLSKEEPSEDFDLPLIPDTPGAVTAAEKQQKAKKAKKAPEEGTYA